MTSVHEPMPPHIEECVRRALRKAHGSDVAINGCDARPASADGENFCSVIYGVDVRYRLLAGDANEAESRAELIVKDMLEEIAVIDSSELQMYEDVLPKLERILDDGLGQKAKLSAKCLLAERGAKELYVLEDLTKVGWSLADRWVGLDAAHARVLLTKIAQFHAASMVYMQRFPGERQLPASHFSEGADDALGKAIAFGGMEYAARMVATWPHFSDVAAKMRANIARFDERVKAVVDPQASPLRVINHGDLWLNNFFFSHATDGPDGPTPKDVVFVDFQDCFVGSPGYDLNYFLYTSVRLEVLQTHRFELLRAYHSSMCDTLAACGAVELAPTWPQLLAEVRRCAFIGYYAAVCELPICCMSREASRGFSASTFTDPEAMVAKNALLYGNERVQQTLRYTLDYFVELGVLDN